MPYKNKEKYKLYQKEYQEKNRDKISKQCKEYYQLNKEKILKQNKKYCAINKIKIKEIRKQYWQKYYLKNKEEIKESKKNYYLENKETIQKRHRINERIRMKFNVDFRLRNYLRRRVRAALKGNPKLETTMKLVGCSIEFLKEHLKSQFTKGMSFSNYGKWHIDHIKPCASFDLSKEEEQKKCFNWQNLQPLWAKDNLSKGVN
jgi:hypothetical protein